MIIPLNQQPEGVIDRGDGFVLYELSDPIGVYGYVELKKNGDVGKAHLHITRWKPSVAKDMKNTMPVFKEICAKQGIKGIFASKSIDNNSNKWAKLMEFLGFPKPVMTLNTYMETDHVR